jgi:hypothetical protein
MRKGISITVTAGDRVRLDAIIGDRNSPQKHVWRARIVLLTVDGNGTNTITRAVGKDKTSVWRWQERFMHEGIAGLIRDKTRPSHRGHTGLRPMSTLNSTRRDPASSGRSSMRSSAPCDTKTTTCRNHPHSG